MNTAGPAHKNTHLKKKSGSLCRFFAAVFLFFPVACTVGDRPEIIAEAQCAEVEHDFGGIIANGHEACDAQHT